MTGRLFALAIALAVAPAAPGRAQPAYYAPCRAGDLGGTWAMVEFESAVPRAQAFYKTHPAAYLRFGYQGVYQAEALAARLTDEAAVNAALDRADASDAATYAARILDDQGRLEITRNGKPDQSYMCVMQDNRMIWTEAKGNPKLVRVNIPIGDALKSGQ